MDVLVIGAGASGDGSHHGSQKRGEGDASGKGRESRAEAGDNRQRQMQSDEHEDRRRELSGGTPDFAFGAFGQFDVQDTVRFFSSIGIYTKNRDHGLYPYSDQAPQVVQLLMEEAQRRKVKCKCSTEITKLEKKDGRFLAHTDGWTYEADACILACGSKAAPETGRTAADRPSSRIWTYDGSCAPGTHRAESGEKPVSEACRASL